MPRPRLLLGLLAALAAGGVIWAVAGLLDGARLVEPVPAGDQEIAWISTTTNGSGWERFVAGAARAAGQFEGLTVDDSRAFLDQTTAVPELVLGREGHPGKLRVRWYKLSGERGARRIIRDLAERSPPP